MNVIIAGSRNFDNYKLLKEKVDNILKDKKDITIVSGTANGADKLGEKYAFENNLSLKKFPADWEEHGKSAGYIRNEQMAKFSQILIAFWNGKSKGTKHMIDLANKHSLDVYVFDINEVSGNLILCNINGLKNIDDDVTKLFIARQPIKNMEKYKLYHVISLSPSYNLFSDYKGKKITWQQYVWRYRCEMFKMKKVFNKIYNEIISGNDIALVCYCGNKNTCHRTIIGNYFTEIGVNVINL